MISAIKATPGVNAQGLRRVLAPKATCLSFIIIITDAATIFLTLVVSSSLLPRR